MVVATTAVVLAGGQGTRMGTDLPKVLHALAGYPMIEAVVRALATVKPESIVVVGSEALWAHPLWQDLRARLTAEGAPPLVPVLQVEAQGTGHAVQTALPLIQGDRVLIAQADVPLIQPETFHALEASPADLILGMMPVEDSQAAYGRIVWEQEQPVAVVEAEELTPEAGPFPWANAGVYGVSRRCLEACLPALKPHARLGKRSEFYLPDLVAEARHQGFQTVALALSAEEAYGVNTPDELLHAPVQTILRRRHLRAGGQFEAPETVILSFDTVIEAGATVGAFNVFGPKVTVRKGARILPFCVLEDCEVGEGCVVGPFAHVKMGSTLAPGAVVGNFVEIKKTAIGPGTKAKHLSYLGDATLGAGVNVGAGTVICNYDGLRKHPTTIQDGVSVGANSSLVAPLTVGEGAFVGAGSVITEDVPAEALALGRARQVCKEGWAKWRG